MKPDSRFGRMRLRLARILDMDPDAGEAWCLKCSLNGGRTVVISADGAKGHVQEHLSEKGACEVKTSWPARPEGDA